jgi:hypothetical protein
MDLHWDILSLDLAGLFSHCSLLAHRLSDCVFHRDTTNPYPTYLAVPSNDTLLGKSVNSHGIAKISDPGFRPS